MSLQGSLETFALPDVLVLLASTKKDGELRVVGGKVDGKVWVENGQIVGSSVNNKETPSVEAVFELLRLDTGTFSFKGDGAPTSRHTPETIDLVLADAQVRLAEWKEIAKVVPHLDVLVDMADKAPKDEVVVTAAQWRLLRSVAGGTSVTSLMASLDLTEFDACKSVKELFESNLVSLELTAKAKAKPEPAPVPDEDAVDVAAVPAKHAGSNGKASGEPKHLNGSSDAARRPAPAGLQADKELAALVDDAAEAVNGRRVRATTSSTSAAVPDPAAAPRNGAASVSGNRASGGVNGSPAATSAAAAATGRPAAPKPAEKPEETKALVAQLAALEGENEEKIAKKVEEHLAKGGELPEVGEGDEPINRGLLLKFLSSVRN